MFGLAALTPTIIKWASTLILIASIIGGYFYWKHEIIKAEDAKINEIWVRKQADATIAASAALEQKNAEIEKRQKDLASSQSEIIAKNKELENAKQDYANLRAQYANNTKRLSVHVASGSPNTTQKSGNSASSPGAGQNTVELMPDISAGILDFARGYQENLRLKNECIDLYNAARNSVNQQ